MRAARETIEYKTKPELDVAQKCYEANQIINDAMSIANESATSRNHNRALRTSDQHHGFGSIHSTDEVLSRESGYSRNRWVKQESSGKWIYEPFGTRHAQHRSLGTESEEKRDSPSVIDEKSVITSNKQEFENDHSEDGGGGHTRLGGSQMSKMSRMKANN